MAVNTLSFEQAASILNELHKNVTGTVEDVTILNLADFVSVGQVVLRTGTDPVMGAISQLVGRTIFSSRAYARRFSGLYADTQRYGYITRKLALSDRDWENDVSFSIQDGQTYTDQFRVKNPNVLQLNFYGQNVFQDHYTVLRNQLNSAFDSPQSLGSFLGLVVQNMSNRIEQMKETTARATMANFIAGRISEGVGLVHVLSEYNTETGQTLTATQVMAPANFDAFAKWLYARVATISSLMTERSGAYQMEVTGKPIMRHTPRESQKVYMLSSWLNAMRARVQSAAFNESFLDYADAEAVNFWQNINSPDEINVTPAYLTANGQIDSDGPAVNRGGIIGMIFDQDALGLTVMDEYTDTAKEAAAGFTNIFFHFIVRWWNDFTEKGVILLLD